MSCFKMFNKKGQKSKSAKEEQENIPVVTQSQTNVDPQRADNTITAAPVAPKRSEGKNRYNKSQLKDAAPNDGPTARKVSLSKPSSPTKLAPDDVEPASAITREHQQTLAKEQAARDSMADLPEDAQKARNLSVSRSGRHKERKPRLSVVTMEKEFYVKPEADATALLDSVLHNEPDNSLPRTRDNKPMNGYPSNPLAGYANAQPGGSSSQTGAQQGKAPPAKTSNSKQPSRQRRK